MSHSRRFLPGATKVSVIKGSNHILQSIFPPGYFRPRWFERIETIERRALITQSAGLMPLWEGYRHAQRDGRPAWGSGARSSDQVRTRPEVGACFYHLTRQLRPETVVEVGTAFGISGMFWLVGLEDNQKGLLYTFDPNPIWLAHALRNLSAVGSRYISTQGTVEENLHSALPRDALIDIGFIDAIHTAEFVYNQTAIIKQRLRDGGVIVFDDIRFSSEMHECWNDLSNQKDSTYSLELGNRVGLVGYG